MFQIKNYFEHLFKTKENYHNGILDFQNTWRSMRSHPLRVNESNTSYHCSFLDAHLVFYLKIKDINKFAGKIYAHGLMAQIVHSKNLVFSSNYKISRDEEKENTFPSVNGVLSTIKTNICPAVLPSMILYMERADIPDDNEQHHSLPDKDKERLLWESRSYIFDNAIKDLIKNLDFLTKILIRHENDEKLSDIEVLDFIKATSLSDLILNSHKELKNLILTSEDKKRIINFPYSSKK
jgi:hypothetical protein